MPQGKGTYGSQVGRPKKYAGGGSVDPFSSKNPEGVIADKEMEAIEEQNAIPETNAMERSQSSPIGNEVGTGVYFRGGMVRLERDRRKEKAQLEDRKKRLGEKSKEKKKKKTSKVGGALKDTLKHLRLGPDPLKGKGKGLAAPPEKKKKKKKKELEGQA